MKRFASVVTVVAFAVSAASGTPFANSKRQEGGPGGSGPYVATCAAKYGSSFTQAIPEGNECWVQCLINGGRSADILPLPDNTPCPSNNQNVCIGGNCQAQWANYQTLCKNKWGGQLTQALPDGECAAQCILNGGTSADIILYPDGHPCSNNRHCHGGNCS